MILIILFGILLGFIMCIPIGPINIWVFRTRMKKGFWPAMSIALGGSTMDFFYFTVILSGLSLFEFNEKTSYVLKVLGISFLFILGIKDIFFTKLSPPDSLQIKKSFKASNYFLLGILIYISNPTLVLSLSTLCTFIKSFNIFPHTIFNNIVFSLSVAVGSTLWFYFLIRLVKRFKKKISQNMMLNITRFSGGLIILLSFYLSYKTFIYGKI